MVDRLDRLERELASLRPVATPRRLADAIEADLQKPDRWSIADRCLGAAMSLGAIAAGVIIAIVARQNIPGYSAPAQPPSVAVKPEIPTLGQYQQALARAGGTSELFR